MRIQFHGAVNNVTGSKHVLEVDGHKLLLDCGLFQGRREAARQRNLQFPFNAKEIDACILSHAHVDHSGCLPLLVKRGFKGKIYTHPATADLCGVMLQDTAHIMAQDAEYLNRHRKSHDPLIEPLYSAEDAEAVNDHWQTLSYHASFSPIPGVTATFYYAGHIIGSVIVHLSIQEGTREIKLVFTGDLGRKHIPILRDPEIPEGADVLVMESTYGNRTHPDPSALSGELAETVKRVIARGGSIVIPAFSVARTQWILYELRTLIQAGRIQPLPVYVDSPLSIAATEMYSKYECCYDAGARELLASNGGRHLFDFDGLRYTRMANESKTINDESLPCIIISASGMCEAGRILHHLKHRLPDKRNLILIVGWQAPHTLGRKLIEGEKQVRILNSSVKVRAEIKSMVGFSAHADAAELEEFARTVPGVQNTFLVHGESLACDALAERLRNREEQNVIVPVEGRWYEL